MPSCSSERTGEERAVEGGLEEFRAHEPFLFVCAGPLVEVVCGYVFVRVSVGRFVSSSHRLSKRYEKVTM